MDRRGSGVSSTGSYSSRSGNFTPRSNSPGPMSPRGQSPVPGRLAMSLPIDGNRGQGIQMTIQNLQYEQERVQKKTFTNWMNTYLCQRTPPIKVENLFEEIRDGVVLLSLLEVLSGEKLPMERGPRLQRPHHLSNMSTALLFLEKKKIKMVNINAADICDGKPSIVLGLIWTIILYFQIEETISNVPNVPDMDGEGPSNKKKQALPKQSLLAWAGNVLMKKYGIKVKDFAKSWRDGVAFNAMIHNIRPDLVDMDIIRKQTAKVNLEHAFSTAEDHLGIARLLDPEDVDVEKPDDKSIMTYVAQFLKAYPDSGDPNYQGVPSTNLDTADKELQAFTTLMNWLTMDADEILQGAQEPVQDRQAEFLEYIGFQTELDRREPIYVKIGEKVLSGKAIRLQLTDWEKLTDKWLDVVGRTQLWLLKLDRSLPGRLGQFGQWLYQAERLLEENVQVLDGPEEMADQLEVFVNRHKEFFKDLESNKQFFLQVKRAGRYEGEFLHPPHLDMLSKRLDKVSKLAPVRQKRLEFEEMKYRLAALLVAAEMKSQEWAAKYGSQESVELLLKDYQDFVVTGQLFENYDKTYTACRKKADAFKKDGAGPDDVKEMDVLFDDITQRWKKVSMETRSLKPMLEESLETWKRYNACVEVLTVWVTEGDQVMKLSADEKQEFFQDIAQYEEKNRTLNESANFLIDLTCDPTANEIRETVLVLNQRFQDLSEGFQTFRQTEVIGRAMAQYQEGAQQLQGWLTNGDAIVTDQIPCVHAPLKEYLQQLDLLNSQIPEIESNFKITTKTAQSLVKDSTQEVVNEMLQTLNRHKEIIVRLRKDIPDKIKTIKSILPNVESLETGISDLNEWLTEGESLLQTHRLDGSAEATEARLEKHKSFFSDTTYQKSILESKKKVFDKVYNVKNKLQNVDFLPAKQLMDDVMERFQNCVGQAKDWEKKLEGLFKLWRALHLKEQVLEEWLDNAETVLDDKEDDPESLLRKHRLFFDRVDGRILDNYLTIGQEILQLLSEADRASLKRDMANLQARWKNIHYNAPMKQLKLEFALPEDKFLATVMNAETIIREHQEKLSRRENVKDALMKHRQLFQDGQLVPTCEKCLGSMDDLSKKLLKHNAEDKSLSRRYEEHAERWQRLRSVADSTHEQLKQLPERWKEYNAKLSDFNKWVMEVEGLVQAMQKEDLTSDEYKDMLAKFQKAMRNKNKYAEDAKWLSENLNELLHDSPDSDARREKERLAAMLTRFGSLDVSMKDASEKSSVFSKSFEYRDGLERRANWLEETQRMVMEHPAIDSVDDARAYLQEHEAIMMKLETEAAGIQADIEAGKRLQKQKDAPSFIGKSVDDLSRKWKDTNELAKSKHAKLKETLHNWEHYEGEKKHLIQYLKKAESELEKPPATHGQDSAQKDLQAKKELHNTLNRLKGSLSEMQKLNAVLAESASRERQGPLKGEVSDIDKRLQNVSVRLNAKLADLEGTIAKWSDYYKRLNNFSDWLNQKESSLNQVYEEKKDLPEEQLSKAETICSEVYENHITLENLEKDARGLSQNFRSRETAALKSKLTSVRRQWESLCARAKDRSTALSGNVAHWQRYQSLQEQLMPWIVKAEKYCATELPKCSSLEEAKDLYDLHQSFLQEAEENLPIFDKMSTEAGYLMELPNMPRELESIQHRWGNILAASEERSHRVDKMYGAWTVYEEEQASLIEGLDKLLTRLSQEPNTNSTDVQVLEHELALAKALQEEVRGYQPQVNAVQRQFEQVQPYTSPDGLRELKAKQDHIKDMWARVNAGVQDKQKVLVQAVQHRKDFYSRLQDFEKWLKRSQRKLDTGSEIYSDEVGDVLAKLKAMKAETNQQDPMFQALQQEFKEMMQNCTEDEAAIMGDRFDKVMEGYTRLEDLIQNRENLCENWTKYHEDHKEAQARLKNLQAKLQNPDLKEEEVAKIKQEIEELRQNMKTWDKDVDELDALMGASQMVIKDRATQRTLHFNSELQSIENLCDTVSHNAEQKEHHLGELAQLSDDFSDKRMTLVDKLKQVEAKIAAAAVGSSTEQGLKELIEELEDIRDDMYAYNPEYEQLRELGRQIMQSDPSKAQSIQAQLVEVNQAWEGVQGVLGEKQQVYSSVANLWQQYNDSKQGVSRVLSDVEPLIDQDIAFSDQKALKKCLDQHKNAEFELHANQTQLDHMNNKGMQLLEELKKVPNFQIGSLENDLDEINLNWEKTNKAVEDHKENMEAQLVCWDQVQSGTDEVASWVNNMVAKLDDSLTNFSDAVSVEARLIKFKEEAPYFAEVLNEVNQKVKDLQEMNSGQVNPDLLRTQQRLQEQFDRASSMAGQLDGVMEQFSSEQQHLQGSISEQSGWMDRVKELLAKCDDLSGSDDDLVARYKAAKELQEELAKHKDEIAAIQAKTQNLHAKYPSTETSNLAKDANVMMKKFEALASRADRVEDSILGTLEHHCQEAQQQQARWLNQAKEKIAWCGDLAGDRYSVEAKLSTVKDLTSGLEEGEQKKAQAVARLEAIKSILPKSKQAELEAQKKAMENEWQSLVGNIEQTQSKLENSIEQWQDYDGQYENLAQWLKETEAKMRSESSLRPDLDGKVEQKERLKELEESCEAQRREFEALLDNAQQIAMATGDNRTASYAGQLLSRFQTLTGALKEQEERCEQNIDDHENFTAKFNSSSDWLKAALKKLEECGDNFSDEESLDAKLAVVQELLGNKDQGLAQFNSALESGEKLFPNTSNEGREAIRGDLRALRNSWENFQDTLNETQRQLEASRMQWSSFDENFDQLSRWMDDMEGQLSPELEKKNTLQEKKGVLQQYKTRSQDITSHQRMIDNLNDKGQALSSSQIRAKLKQLNNKYNTLRALAQSRVDQAEEYVDQHQQYQDQYQQCRDWMTTTKDRLVICAEVTSDKQALQNRMDRAQDIRGSMSEGEQKLNAVRNQGDKVIPQTATSGQASIRQELEALRQDWEGLGTQISDIEQNLVEAQQALVTYDGSCDSLGHWLRDTEAELKDQELKSSLEDKMNQMEHLKQLEQQILDNQAKFDELQSMAFQIQGTDPRQLNYSTQLATRYEGLKTRIKDAIAKSQELADEHQAYQANYSQAMDWVSTLRKRLQACGELAGDRQDVEDRLVKLQELAAEKDDGRHSVMHAIDMGEKLYPSTASEGRDAIRQDLRNLRDQWECVCDEVASTQRKLESTLMEWAAYDENYDQFHKWLLDVQLKLRDDAELKTTLPDKKAQLQNHKVLHQDILSRQHIIQSLSEKAQNLTQSSPAAKVQKFVNELNDKYEKLCETSKKILDKFETAVKDHQQYQDACHDFQDWLNLSREKLESCADRSGDKLSLQSKKERLKDFTNSISIGEAKLSTTKELCNKTFKNTSPAGCDILQRELEHLQREWDDYLGLMSQAEQSLDQAMVQWADFETKFDTCADWLKEMEQQVKSYELKSTLKEKEAQVEKFKKQREEILSHQPEIDRFMDDAQNLMHTSSDVRLSTQVSQLTNRYQAVLSLVKDLINKWEKYVHEHQTYDNRLSEFQQWLQLATQRLETCQQGVGDQDSVEEKRALIQILFSEKEHGLQKLNLTIEAGERLYPDTAGPGRERVRQDIRACKESWERLFAGLNDAQRKVDAFLLQWSSYADGQDQLMRWLGDTEGVLRSDVEVKNTLQEKRLQLQNHRSLLQDVQSHQRLVDTVVEKAQGVLQTTTNADVASFITSVNSRYEKLTMDAKAVISKSEQHVEYHQQYQDALHAAVDWMTHMKDKQTMCADTSGDRQTIQNKLDRLQELTASLPDGISKIKECETSAEVTMNTTALKGRQVIQQEVDVLHLDWEDHTHKLTSLKDNLEQALHYWVIYEENYDKVAGWIKDMERKVKEVPLKSTLEEKREQFTWYQALYEEILHQDVTVSEVDDFHQDLRTRQHDIDKFTDEAQTLQQLTGETRVGNFASQLATRYQTLLTAAKNIIKKCEQNVEDHKQFKEKFNSCSQWLAKAKARFAEISDASGSRAELEERLEKAQDLLRDRDAGFVKLSQVVEAGEKLYPSTAPEGREATRQDLRRLKLGWESLFDELSASQRRLEVSLVQWTSFDDSYSQVENWLRDMEGQLEGTAVLRATLEEKKSQLHNFKALHQDVLSYQRVIDSISDKAQSLVQSSNNPELSRFISGTGARYQKLCIAAKDRVQQYEVFVADHQQYNDAYNVCVDWLNSIREKLSICSDVSGDRHAIQSRLDKIQDILATRMEGEPKVKNVVILAEKVLPYTAPQGKEIIVRETEALRADWEAFISALAKTKSDLESCMIQWKEFETWQEKCADWLKESENKIRNTDLKSTLQEKQAQLERLKALHTDVGSHQGDLDSLSDAAQDLVQLSTDTRVVSQVSQLSTKFQMINVNIKELCRRWDQYVLDHESYITSFDQCKAWLRDMKDKVSAVMDTSGDKNTIQTRLQRVQELMSEKEEGLHMLQIALDNLQVVLPNTSVGGRDLMRREMQAVQQEYDGLSGDLNEVKLKLDGCLAQWTVYDDSVQQLQRWLNDLETQVQTESQLQNTLQEKKLQLDRVKVLQLNINSQQSTIDSMNDKAENLRQTSKDMSLSNQIREIVSRYDKMGAKTKELLQNCDNNLRNHQVYRDTYVDMTDWLSSAMDRLAMCSDIRGDRHAIEALQHKVQEIVNTVDTGRQKMETVRTKGQSILPQTSSHGQELIQEELTMLANDFTGFESSLAELMNTLESLHSQWQQYEESYEKLSQWIKDMEASMKADSELKSTVDDKKTQLDKQKAVHEEILEQQAVFDNLAEQAQILMQSSKDSRVSTQLTQMSSRYTTLLTLSKDLMKRYELHCQDHQQYDEVYDEARAWLQTTRDKLSVCTDTSGDRYTIQTQLEKLQEFNVMKEEGQVLIHTANTWGEKTMMNSAAAGREMVRGELQQLQSDWDELVSEVTDTKVLLESCLLQWTEFSDSHSNVQRWLKETEKKLKETSPKADISEKKGELQRIKVIYQDIVSYEQMVESMIEKARHLAEKSPASHTTTDTSQIAAKYHTLKEQAKELLAKNEQYVANHQDFLDNCNQFITWLRTAIEKLATCSDTYGEKSAIEGKIERVQALVQNLTEGTQRLSLATKSGEATLPSTSPKGQTKIRHELQTMHKDFDEFRGQLVQAQSDLELCLSRWEEFEESFQEFNQWLKDTENMMRSEFDQKGTVDEKKHQWEQYQRRLDDILSHQSALDCVSEKGQALLEANADARISHSITQMTTRYQAVIAHSKDLVSSLEASFKNHALYRQNSSQFRDWLAEIKHRLQEAEDDHGNKDSIEVKLDHIDQLQDFMDHGHNLLRSLLESSEKTLPSTNPRGCHSIRQETDGAKSEYEDVLTAMSQARRSLENALSHWGEFDRLYSQLDRSITDLEVKLRAEHDYKADLPEKRSNLEKFKAIESDIMGHQDILDKLREKADLVKDSTPGSNLAGLLSRFQNVAAISREAMTKAEQQVLTHEEYRKAYIGCLDWLANTKHRLQRLSDYSGDKKTLQDRLQQLRDFKSDLQTGQDMVNRVASLGDRLCQTTAPRGQDIVRREVQSLREDWGAFSNAVSDVESNLESCISNWLELDDDHGILLTWLTTMESEVKALSEPRANQALKTKQYKEGEDLYDDIVAKKGALDKVREKGDSIAQRSSDPRLSNSMMQLSTKYQSLCSTAKSMLQRLRDNLHDQQLYDDALTAATRWLTQTQERVRSCSDTSGDWHSIQARIEDIKDVTSSMDDGLQKVNFVCDMAEKILPNTSKEGKKLIEEQVTDLTNDWEKLNDLINEGTNMLEGVQQRWHEYEEYYGSIVKWLADMESILSQEPEAKATLAEKKTQQDKYKLILQDIDTHHRLVNELADRVANLEALCSNPEVSASLSDIEKRYEAVRTKARQMVDTTQKAYEDHLDFHEAQQEAEKWLLQMSYRLMSHNSLNVSSLEMTQRQIDKHRVLIHEIEDYRHNLDQVNRKGQQLIAANRSVPQLAHQIQSQIQNLEESYSNLELTARQIRDRLNDVYQKWQQYKDLLETALNFLEDDLPSWLQDSEADVPDTLEEAQSQRESTQAMLDKLTQMKQELTTSSVRCENLGSMDSLDQTEAALTDSISQLADKVNAMIHEAISQVERRLDRMRDVIRQWDSVDRQRTDLRHWLHSKQEEVNDLDQRPSKLHAEAAELDIEKLTALREEIQARGPAIKELLAQYHALTEHSPSLVDPVVRALQDDWEELLGELDILIDRRRGEMVSARDLQVNQETMDEDLENYVRELERIDQADASVQNKSMRMKTRRPCRSTQTPNTSRQHIHPPDDSPDDSFRWKTPRGSSKGKGQHPGSPSMKRSRSGNLSRSMTPRTLNRSLNHSRVEKLKKGAAAAAGCESDSEESGYGDTCGDTMHASSFDTHLEEPLDWLGSESRLDTPTVFDSDTESITSFVTGVFPPVNPEDLRNAASQTPLHSRTQTDDAMFPRSVETQTELTPHDSAVQTSTTSLHTIGAQTKKKSKSKSNLLRSILSEVKDIKRQQGMLSSNSSFCDDVSVASDASIQKEQLETLYRDVQDLKNAGRQGDAMTQTISQQATQTSLRLFPEGDNVRRQRQGRFQELFEEVGRIKTGDRSSPSQATSRSVFESPFDQRNRSSLGTRATSTQMESPKPISGEPAVARSLSVGPYVNGFASAPPTGGAQANGPQPYEYERHFMTTFPMDVAARPPPVTQRRVTMEDLNNVNERLDRLRNYQLPPRRALPVNQQPALDPSMAFAEGRRALPVMPPPVMPPPVMPPPILVRPRRYRVREFVHSYDDMDLMSGGIDIRTTSRRQHRTSNYGSVMGRYHLDDALSAAASTARHLKKLSTKMKRDLRNELTKHGY